MSRLRIGISANFFHKGTAHQHKTLIYGEEHLYQWVASSGSIPYMIPRISNGLTIKNIVEDLDAIIFSGGADISPKSYGEEPLKPEWSGDYERDKYDIELFHIARELNKPILGICRGHQLINVALGGTMYQDINTQVENTIVHRNGDIYDDLKHEMQIIPNTKLAEIFTDVETATINTVHHQAIKDLGNGLIVQAKSTADNIIESIWLDELNSYVMGVQWHPEWVRDADMLDSQLILNDFLGVISNN